MENISLGIDIFSVIFITFVLLKTLVFLIRQNEMYRFGKTKCDYFV